MFRIGALARLLGVTPQTLRFYELEGLLASPERSANGYRLYDDAAVRQLKFIQRGKQAGLSNHELKELLAIRQHGDATPCIEVKAIIDAKLLKVREQIERLQAFEASLGQLSHACSGDGLVKDCSIMEALDELLD
jgi:MerR family Zn(II)-responsive transcriptional regulator of zntA